MATCTVSGTFLDPKGNAVSSATVRFNLERPVVDGSGNLLMPKEVTTTTATDGTWSLVLLQSISGFLTLDLNPTTNAPVVKYKFSMILPASSSATFASCWADSSTFGGQGVPTPLTFSGISGTLGLSQLPPLPSADVWVGSSLGAATPVGITGDVSLSNTGVCTVNTVGTSTAANIHTAEQIANTATNLNTASSVVQRDASGNFSAGTITASVTGHSSLDLRVANNLSDVASQQTALNNLVGGVVTSGNILRGSGSNVSMAPIQASDVPTLNQNTTGTAASFTGSLVGDVTGTQGVTAVSKINGVTVSGTTGTGNVVFATSPTLTSPVVGTQTQGDASTKAASTSYVDTAVSNAISGVNPAVAVQAATTAAGNTSGFTYTHVAGIGDFFTGSVNTAVTIDGFTFTALGQRLLIKDDTQNPSGAFNGIYTVTQLQTAIVAPILTRALDYDTPSDINNTGAIPVVNGTVNGTTSWVQTGQIVTVGTTPLVFVKFSRNPADYLLKSNNLSDVSTAATAFANIAPAPSTSGNVLTSNGSSWASSPAGASVGTTTTYTPTVVGNGSVSNMSAFYQYVGDRLFVTASWTTGTCTGVAWSFSLPTAHSAIDYSKITTNAGMQHVGQIYQGFTTSSYAGGTGGPFPIFVDGTTTGTVFVCAAASSSLFVKSNGNGPFNNSATLSLKFDVPTN